MILTNFYALWLAITNENSNIGDTMKLKDAQEGREYLIKDVLTDDDELNSFLFSLGCYSGERITVVSKKKSGFVVSIKDGRYNIDLQLAGAIVVQ